MKSRLSFRHGALLVTSMLVLHACGGASDAVYKDSTYAMGSIVEFTLYGVDEARARAAVAAAVDDLNFMHGSWHPWQAGALARMNGLFPLGGRFTAATSVLPLVRHSTEFYEKSGGLFNPAIGKLVQLWGFHRDELPTGPPPTPEQIAAVLALHPRMTDIHIDGIEIESGNPHVVLDFGAFAQGYAADRVIEQMRALGIEHAIVNISGDVHVIGRHGDRPWRIGIRNPRGEGVIASVQMHGDESLVTSGDYERFYMYEGRRYHHILDPRTGYPATGATSVTVIDPQAAVADAAATALMIAGEKDWYAVARAMGVKHVMLVDPQGRVHMDPATARRIKFEIEPAPQVVLSDPL